MDTAELTLESLRSLELLEAAATPGPWVVAAAMGQVWRGPIESTRGMVKGLTKDAHPLFDIEADDYYHLEDEEAAIRAARADRNLIAEMRSRLPVLLAKARRALELEHALAWLRQSGAALLTGFDLNPEAILTKATALGWPGLPEPKGPTMCEDCEGEAATCFHEEDKQHLCDACCDHDDGCRPVETRG